MTDEEAWWILRAEIELTGEGIWVGMHTPEEPGDADVIKEAWRLAGHRVPEYQRDMFETGADQ